MLDDLLARVAKLPLSYPDVGMTRAGATVPSRYVRDPARIAPAGSTRA